MGDNFAPSFTQKPKLRQEDDGNKLIFDCKLSASPQPSIEWFREDTPVKESSRVKITVKPGKGGNIHDVQLILDDVEEEDAGLYKVKAKNKYGEVSASINLNFSPNEQPVDTKQIDGLAPTFAQKPVIKQEEGGKHIKFECRILADPRPTITWFRDGLKVQESPRCKVTIEKDEKSYFVTMAFTNVTVEDAGKYKVTAKNELGESNATISLNFDTDEAPSPKEGVRPTFTERPSIKQSEDGTSVIFSCRCVANPQPTVVWEFKGKQLREGARHRMKLEPDGKLYYMVILEVNKVSNADEGEYKAVASNKLGEGVATINLHFEGKTASDKPKIPDGKAPRFPKKPEIRQEGDKLVMECILEANPEPEVTWFKGTEIIQEQGRISMYKKICGKDQYIVSVTIMKPEASDGGQWRCNAFNPFGDSNANIALNFEKGKAIPEGFAPTFLDKPSIIPNESGTMITMKVRCKAKPQPTVEWFKDGKKLEAAKRLVIKEHKVTAEMFEYSCIVKDPCGADAGKYKCVAMNQFGEATANVNLNIESDPEPTGQAPVFVEKPTIKFEEKAGRVLMEALVRADPKPTSRWTKDGKELDVTRVTATVTREKDDLYRIRMELRKPQPTDGGVYKCNIKNEFGELNANLNLNIEVAPTIKRPPRIVSVFNRKVVIECVVISTSKPACNWFKDSSKVRLDTRHCVNINEEGDGKYVVQMEMLKAEKMDCGSYKVVAKNEKGETTSQAVELTMDMLEEKEEKKKEEVKEEKMEQQEAAQVVEESKKEEKAVKKDKPKRREIKKEESPVDFTKVQLKKLKPKEEEDVDEAQQIELKKIPDKEQAVLEGEKVKLKKVTAKEEQTIEEAQKVQLQKVGAKEQQAVEEGEKVKLKKVRAKEEQAAEEAQKIQLKKVGAKEQQAVEEGEKVKLKKVGAKEQQAVEEGEKAKLKKVGARKEEAVEEAEKVQLKKVETVKVEAKKEEARETKMESLQEEAEEKTSKGSKTKDPKNPNPEGPKDNPHPKNPKNPKDKPESKLEPENPKDSKANPKKDLNVGTSVATILVLTR